MLVVQIGVFLAGAAVVKKLLVEPYISVRDRRDRSTIGNRDEANQILVRCESIAQDIAGKLGAAANAAKQAHHVTRAAATKKSQETVEAAQVASKARIEAMEQQVSQELASERAKIPQIVAALSDDLYQVALA